MEISADLLTESKHFYAGMHLEIDLIQNEVW